MLRRKEQDLEPQKEPQKNMGTKKTSPTTKKKTTSAKKKIATKKVPKKNKNRGTSETKNPVKTSKKTPVMKKTTKKKKVQSSKKSRKLNPDLQNLNLPDNYLPNKKEEYMNPMQLLYFQEKLFERRRELINQSQETLHNLKTEIRDVSDDAERASRESDNILELRTRDRYRKLLSKIDSALRRIDDGSYGYCEETGEEIGLGRLEARPTATLTVDAQERREMLQRQFRDDR